MTGHNGVGRTLALAGSMSLLPALYGRTELYHDLSLTFTFL